MCFLFISLLNIIGELARVQGDLEQAARLVGASDALIAETGTLPMPGDQPEYDRIVAQIRRQLDRPTFEAMHAEGQSLARECATPKRGPDPPNPALFHYAGSVSALS